MSEQCLSQKAFYCISCVGNPYEHKQNALVGTVARVEQNIRIPHWGRFGWFFFVAIGLFPSYFLLFGLFSPSKSETKNYALA